MKMLLKLKLEVFLSMKMLLKLKLPGSASDPVRKAFSAPSTPLADVIVVQGTLDNNEKLFLITMSLTRKNFA